MLLFLIVFFVGLVRGVMCMYYWLVRSGLIIMLEWLL